LSFQKGERVITQWPFEIPIGGGAYRIPARSLGVVTRGPFKADGGWLAVTIKFDFDPRSVFDIPVKGIKYANALQRLAWET